MPYFDGPNRALWVAIRNSTAYSPVSLFRLKASTASKAMPSSLPFRAKMMRVLLSRSARDPANGEKSRKGITNSAPARAATPVAFSGPLSAIRKKMISSLSRLSFSAPKNWVRLSQVKDFGRVLA